MKMKYLLYIPLLFVCVLTPFRQSSTDVYIFNIKPCVRWGSWQVGQTGGYGNTLTASFITNSETTCCVNVSVSYCTSQPSSYAEAIIDFDFEITMNNGFKVEKSEESTTGPDASLLDPTTTFSVEAKLNGPPDKENLSCSQNGRNNTPMQVTVTFKGYYASDTKKQNPVTLTKTWLQFGVDIIRQEYVDMTPPDTRAELPVPGKEAFEPTISSNGNDQWNTGDYSFMIDESLKDKKALWLAEVNKYRKSKRLSEFTDEQFVVLSGYRSPYHNRFHAWASFHSRHCYGDALDVRTVNVNGVDGVEQLKFNPKKKVDNKPMTETYAKSESADAVLMEQRAIDAGAKFTLSWEAYATHTHADWTTRDYGVWPPRNGTVYSPPCEHSQESSPTTSTSSTTTSTEPSTPGTTMHVCGVHATTVSGNHSTITPPCGDSAHAGYACQISSDHNTTISGWSGTFYECQPHTTFSCGHTDPNANSAYHAYGTFPCGISTHVGNLCTAAAASDALNHTLQASCSVTNANGDSCTVTAFYACQPHTHVYPALIIICARRPCNDVVSTAREHWVTCKVGHAHWGCHPWHENHHRVRTCRRTNCGQSWQRCSRPTNDRTPDCLASPGNNCAAIQ